MKLGNVGLRFRSKFKILNGQSFFGQILDLPDTSRVSNFLSARRYLRVHVKSPITAGKVIIADGQRFLVADHGTGFFVKPIYKHFKLFYVDEQREWFTKTDQVDSVTGAKKKSAETSNGIINVSVQPKTDIEDSISIQTTRHTIVTNAAVKVDDKIGPDWVVTKVDPQLGLYVAEVKEG
jgi:hypothetical protein